MADKRSQAYQKLATQGFTSTPGDTAPIEPVKVIPTKATEPITPDIKKQTAAATAAAAPIAAAPTGIQETPMADIRRLYEDRLRDEAIGGQSTAPKFSNRPELLEQGEWILPKGMRVAQRGEKAEGPIIANPMDFIPRGSHSYAAMAQVYPEMFEDPKLVPIEAEIADYEKRGIKDPGPVTRQDYAEAKAIYNEEDFENKWFQEQGNPFDMNPVGELNFRWNREKKAIFNEAFQGTIDWSQRSRMNKDQRQFWQMFSNQKRAEMYRMLAAERTNGIAAYENAIGNFRSRRKTLESSLKRMETEQQKAQKLEHPFNAVNKKGVMTRHFIKNGKVWDSGTPSSSTDSVPEYIKGLIRVKSSLGRTPEENMLMGIMRANGATPDEINAMFPQQDEEKIQTIQALEQEIGGWAKESMESVRKSRKALGIASPQKTIVDPIKTEKASKSLKKPAKIKEIANADGSTIPVYGPEAGVEYDDGAIIYAPNKANEDAPAWHVVESSGKKRSFQTEDEAKKYHYEIVTGSGTKEK